MCVKIIQQLTSATCQGYFFGRDFSFRFLHRHSGFASGHCNGTVAIEFHPKIEQNIHLNINIIKCQIFWKKQIKTD